jgi:hypothetical protein
MAATFPLPAASLADLLPIASGLWEPIYSDEFSGLGSGEMLNASLAPMLWGASVEAGPMYLSAAKQLRARILLLDGSSNALYFWSPEAKAPQADPDGASLGASTVKVKSVGDDNKSLALKGLPAGYALTIGDMVAVDYGSRRALFALAASGNADGSGDTAEIEVRPHIRPGVVTDCLAYLVKPAAKVKIVPSTLKINSTGGALATITFDIRQTLQAG